MTIEERKARLLLELTLLQKPVWGWKDVSEFVQCASARAVEIKKQALELGGKVDYSPHGVQSRYVLKLMGTTPEDEIRKRMIEYQNWAAPKTESEQ